MLGKPPIFTKGGSLVYPAGLAKAIEALGILIGVCRFPTTTQAGDVRLELTEFCPQHLIVMDGSHQSILLLPENEATYHILSVSRRQAPHLAHRGHIKVVVILLILPMVLNLQESNFEEIAGGAKEKEVFPVRLAILLG